MITAVSQKKLGSVPQKDEERHRKVHIMQYHRYEVPEQAGEIDAISTLVMVQKH